MWKSLVCGSIVGAVEGIFFHFMSKVTCQTSRSVWCAAAGQCVSCAVFFLLFSPLYTLWEWSSELQLCFWFHSAVMCLTAGAPLRFPSQFLAVSPLKRDKSKSTAGGSQAASQTQNTHRNTRTNPVWETVISSCLGLQWPLSLLLKATSGLKVQRQRR